MVNMDTRLPLLVQQPDIVNALATGTRAAADQANVLRAAEGQNIFRQHGAGAMQGNQNALAAIAGFDPQIAQGIQATNLDMDATRLNMTLTQERIGDVRRQAAAAARAEKDQAAARKELEQAKYYMRGLGQAYLAGDAETWGIITSELGLSGIPMDESGLRLADATISGFEEGLSGIVPEAPEMTAEMRNLEWRARQAGLQPGTAEYAQFMAQGGRNNGFVFEQTADGGLRMAQGDAATSFKFTEGQSKDNVYATRAEGALALLDSVGAEALADRGAIIADAVPLGLARGLQSEDFQVAQQSGEEFLQAILRKDTGAAITAQEQDLYGKTYLPQPGDGPQVLEAKRRARIRAVEALKAGMNIQQLTVTERALIQAAERANPAPEAPESAAVPDGIDPADWEFMTPEERALFQ